jgi:hypothetical protein
LNDILFKIFPFLAKHMSNRAASLLSGFGLLSLFALALYVLSLSAFKESASIFLIAFLVLTAMIPLSFLVLWVPELKHEWDMRVVAVIPTSGSPFPQNAINARKAGYRFRRPTRNERAEWGLNKKEKLSVVLRKLLFMTNEELEAERREARLSDPSLPIQEFKKIRDEQERRKSRSKTS